MASAVSTVSGAGVDLHVADEMKIAKSLSRSVPYLQQARRVSCGAIVQLPYTVHHLLTTELAQTLACNLVLSRLDYCNALLHGTPTGNIDKLQRVQNNAPRVVLQAPRRSHTKPLLHQLHWLPVKQRISYKLAVLTFKVRTTSTPSYLSRHIKARDIRRTLRSSSATALSEPFSNTAFGK